jgi:hypothetical protein
VEAAGHFVDNPSGTLADADRLVRELMLRRGYPMAASSAARRTFR